MRWAVVGKDDHHLVQGGMNRYATGLVTQLEADGDLVEFFAVGRPLGGSRRVGLGSSMTSRMIAFSRAGWRSSPDLDVINVHFALYAMPFLASRSARSIFRRKSKKRPVIIANFQGPWAAESRAAGEKAAVVRVKKAMEEYCLRRADHVVVLSSAFADTVTRDYGVNPLKVRQVAPGIDDVWFEKIQVVDLPSKFVELICVRRLTPRMGHLKLLGLLEDMDFETDGKPIRLHLVGTGAEQPQIEAWIHEHARVDSVVLHGYVPDGQLMSLMDQCDVSVVPTLQLEGFGLIVLEAMARGLPVVSTGQGGLREAMGPWGRPPFIFSLESPQEFNQAIDEALLLRGQVTGQEKLIRYARVHSWSSVCAQIRALATG
jgi:glycosyltransferase involved in cell wall biosynthesis